jgi:hypothetical protein
VFVSFFGRVGCVLSGYLRAKYMHRYISLNYSKKMYLALFQIQRGKSSLLETLVKKKGNSAEQRV